MPTNSTRYSAASMILCGLMIAGIYLLPFPVLFWASPYFVIAVILVVTLGLPRRIAITFFIIGLALNVALHKISVTKISLTEMPLTFLDLKIATQNPGGFLSAMNWPPVYFYGGLAIFATLCLALLFLNIRGHIAEHGAPGLRSTGKLFTICAASIFAVHAYSERMYNTIKPPSSYIERTWSPAGVSILSTNIGIVPFLMFTAKIQNSEDGNLIYSRPANGAPPAPAKSLASEYVNIPETKGQQPNVVVMLLESTFDINKAFKISPPVQTTLSANYENALLQGMFEVNAIGGGTWITEFETLTGIDSRLFGYSGFYTHVNVAPKIKSSLATWFQARGYSSMTLYPVPGNFYSARNAYAKYGFKEFYDSDHFELENPWRVKDEVTMGKYLQKIPAASEKPFFVYALTLENHAPHPCINFRTGEMPHRLDNEANHEMNCQINEYILRQQSTERAVNRMEEHLRTIEARTGRPYVLALFGDHQPHTFVGTQAAFMLSTKNYDALRQNTKTQTFYQIRGSVKSPFKQKVMEIPSVLLPSIVSAFAAENQKDVYMDINFSIYAHCDAAIPLNSKGGLFSEGKPVEKQMTSACSNAIDAAIPVYRDTALIQ